MAACSASSPSGGTTTCASVPACAGGEVQACTTTDGAGACTSTVYKFNGKDHACASCADCTQVAMDVAAACTHGPFDAGGTSDGEAGTGNGPDAAGFDAATHGVECGAPVSCGNGGSYQFCRTTDSGACTSASYDFSDGTSYACSSCTDCATAVGTVAAVCSPDAGGPTDAGGEAGDVCGFPPTLHPELQPGVYCPFTGSPTKTICAAGQQCCEAPSGMASTCQAPGTSCPIPSSSSWACEDALDCAGSAAGPVCCGMGMVAVDPNCGFHRGTGFTGSHCAQSCAPSEVVICEGASQCAGGTTCTPFKTQGLGLGVCL